MSDAQALFAVLSVLYLIDCIGWAPHTSLVFVLGLRGRWRPRFPSAQIGTGTAGAIVIPPVPPVGGIVVVHRMPVLFSRDAVMKPSMPGKTGQPSIVEYARITAADVSGKTVRINGKPFVECELPEQARLIAEILSKAAATAAEKRTEEIGRLLRARDSADAIATRLSEFRATTLGLRIACWVLLVYLFVAAPIAVSVAGFARVLWPAAAGLVACVLPVVVQFHRLHARWYAWDREGRVRDTLNASLCPPAAIRVMDQLTRNLLGFHSPMAIAYRICAHDEFLALARRAYFGMDWIVEQRAYDGQAKNILAGHMELERQLCVEFLRENGVDENTLLQAPARFDASSASYCPCCHTEYVLASGMCSDCTCVELVPFGEQETAVTS